MLGMVQRAVGLRLDPDLLRRVDVARGDVPRNRWIERVLEREVGRRETNAGYLTTGEGAPVPDPLPPRASESSRASRVGQENRVGSPLGREALEETSSARGRAPVPTAIPSSEATLTKLAQNPRLAVELSPEQVERVAEIQATRRCSRCGVAIKSPSLTRHPSCGGKIVPEPV